MNVAGKTALVTGASNGIGERLARQLADRHANLVLAARRGDKLAQLKDEINSEHPEVAVTIIAADLADGAAAGRIADQLPQAGTTIDLLVNSQIQLNVGSLVDLTARFLPDMLARDFGGVLNVASTAAFEPVPTIAVYGATKAFVLSFSEALSGETRGTGVRVLTLCPGATETAFLDNTGKSFLTKGRQSPAYVAQVALRALRALDGSSPTVVSGLSNRQGATGYRFLPRSLMVRLSANQVKESAA